ncbi:hypothetical protein Tco_0407039, partial [Tanacetum coccineum]
IMGEPLSPDRVFDFPMDEPEPHPAYDFFAPGQLPSYAGNPNNMNGWIDADVSLLGELGEMGEPLGAEVDESMVYPMIDELAEPIVEERISHKVNGHRVKHYFGGDVPQLDCPDCEGSRFCLFDHSSFKSSASFWESRYPNLID